MQETKEMMAMKESNKKVLTKRDITLLGFRSSFLQASFNYERMQAGGWTCSMLPTIEKIVWQYFQISFVVRHALCSLTLSAYVFGQERTYIKYMNDHQ